MKCTNCNFETTQDFTYCPNCGSAQNTEPVAEPVSLNPAADKIFALLKDNLFLVVCILLTVSAATSVISGGIPLFTILIAIFLWCIYSSAQKGFVNENQLRNISGTVYASYIVTNVLAGIFVFLGLLMSVMSSFLSSLKLSDILNELSLEFNEFDVDISDFLYDLPQNIVSIIGILLAIMFIFIAAAILVFNILGIRKIHRFIKSVYMGVMYQNPNFEKVNAAKNWILVFAIFIGISALFSLTDSLLAFASTGCQSATLILVYILIDKYLTVKNTFKQ